MKTTYDGACMALPERDEDLFAQINAKTAQRRQIQEREAMQGRYFDNAYSDTEADGEPGAFELDLSRALPWVGAVAAMLAGMILGRLM